MDTLNRDDFAPQLNTVFQFYLDPEAPTGLELIEVSEVKRRSQGESFSLVFQGPAEPVYDQRLFRVEHPVLGSGELFLVPVGRVREGIHYEALFNRSIES